MSIRIIPEQYIDIASDLSIFMSVISLAISIFLFIEARKIYKLFIGKARIPEIIKSLEKIYPDISDKTEDFSNNREYIFRSFLSAKSIVENLEEKLTKDLQRKKCREFLLIFRTKNNLFFHRNKTEFTLEESLIILRELSALVVTLSELEKDLKWN